VFFSLVDARGCCLPSNIVNDVMGENTTFILFSTSIFVLAEQESKGVHVI
jgi:hypothetical protein